MIRKEGNVLIIEEAPKKHLDLDPIMIQEIKEAVEESTCEVDEVMYQELIEEMEGDL